MKIKILADLEHSGVIITPARGVQTSINGEHAALLNDRKMAAESPGEAAIVERFNKLAQDAGVNTKIYLDTADGKPGASVEAVNLSGPEGSYGTGHVVVINESALKKKPKRAINPLKRGDEESPGPD